MRWAVAVLLVLVCGCDPYSEECGGPSSVTHTFRWLEKCCVMEGQQLTCPDNHDGVVDYCRRVTIYQVSCLSER